MRGRTSHGEPEWAEPRTPGGAPYEEHAPRSPGSQTRGGRPETRFDPVHRSAGAPAAPAEAPATGTTSPASTTVINNTTYIGEIHGSQVAIGNQGGVTQIRKEIQEAARQCGDDLRRTTQSFRESLQASRRTHLADPVGTSPLSPTSNTLPSGPRQATLACQHVKVVLEEIRADLPAMHLGHAAEQDIRRRADDLDAHLAGTRPDLVLVRAGLDEIITVLSDARRAGDSPAGQKTTESLVRIRAARAGLDTSAVA
ncbi:hypothetical protein [Streptomyces sp. NPDC047043]|uniref:hypothetical protein n=1 Tax=Streptomyces sp. NPDC047043 TaxID=3154497 RepID=UPI0033EB7D12